MSDGQYETRGGGARRADDAPPAPPYGAAPPSAQRGSPDPRGAAYGGDRLRRAPSAAPSDHSGSGNFGENFELDDFLERDEAYRQIMTLSGVGAESPLDDGAGDRMWSDDAFGSPGGGTSQRAGAAGGRGWSPGAGPSPAGRPFKPVGGAEDVVVRGRGAAGSFDGGVDAYGEAFDDGSMSFAGLSDGEPLSAASASLRAAAMANYYHGDGYRAAEPRRDDPVYAAAIAGRLDAGPEGARAADVKPEPDGGVATRSRSRRGAPAAAMAPPSPRAAYDRSDGYDDFGGGMMAGEASLYDDAFAAPSRRAARPGQVFSSGASSASPWASATSSNEDAFDDSDKGGKGKRGGGATPAVRRLERNMREQKRSNQISQQIDGLRRMLTDAGVAVKASKSSILMGTASYIRNLEKKHADLESERQRMLSEMCVLLQSAPRASGGAGGPAPPPPAPQAPAAPHRDDAARPEDAGDDARRGGGDDGRDGRGGPRPRSRDGDSPPADHKRYCVPAPAPRPDGDGARAPMDDGSVTMTTHSSSRPPEVPPRRGIHDARELEQIYELVFADNAVPMAVVTLDGRFLRTNARFVTSSGFTADELSRVTIFNLTAPAHLHVAFSYMSLVLRGLDPASHLFVCAVTRDAKPAPFALAVSLVTRDGRAQYFSTTLVPLSNVPPQLFANDAERERHGCPPAPRGDDGGRGRRDDRRDDQARGRGAPPGPAGAPRPHPTSGPSTAADRRGAAAARAPGGDEPPPPPRGRDHKQQRHPPAGVRS